MPPVVNQDDIDVDVDAVDANDVAILIVSLVVAKNESLVIGSQDIVKF